MRAYTDLLTMTELLDTLNADPRRRTQTHAPLAFHPTDYESFFHIKETGPVPLTADDILDLTAMRGIRPRYQGGVPEMPRRVVWSLAEVQRALGWDAPDPEPVETNGDKAVGGEGDIITTIEGAAQKSGIVVSRIEQALARGEITDHAEPQFSDPTWANGFKREPIPTKPRVSIREIADKLGRKPKLDGSL